MLLLLVAARSLAPEAEMGRMAERIGEGEMVPSLGGDPVDRPSTIEATPAAAADTQSRHPPASVVAVREPEAVEEQAGQATVELGAAERATAVPTATNLVKRATPTGSALRLADLTAADAGQIVEARGILASMESFSAGFRGMLDDGTARLTVVLWQDTYDALPEPESVVVGSALAVRGRIQEYAGDLQIVPLSAADLKVTGRLALPLDERNLSQIAAVDVGQRIQVAGQIAKVVPFSQGVKYVLDDGTATCILLLWQNVLDRMAEGDSLRVGAQVLVRGEVAEYQGALEIVPPIPYDVEIVAPAEPGTVSEPASRPVGSLSSDDVGSLVTLVQAGIADLEYFSKGIKLTLVDDSGRIVLLLWQNVLEEIPERYQLRPNNEVKVTGVIDQYQGEMEIVPGQGTDLIVLATAGSGPVTERTTGALSAADEGQIVTVQGMLIEIAGDTWRKLWLDDGTGQVLVFVPQRVVEYLHANLQVGQRLRVTGEVDIYSGQVEIVPLAGGDIQRQ
jgi:DNA/RNA endonuclease YhcR with UshA esterase domain